MFRTVLIHRGERLSIRENWLVVTTEEGEKKIPLEDIDSVVIDNPILTFTVPAMTRLTENGAHEPRRALEREKDEAPQRH